MTPDVDELVFKKVAAPAILIVTEEDYEVSKDWAEKIRQKAAYFINLS